MRHCGSQSQSQEMSLPTVLGADLNPVQEPEIDQIMAECPWRGVGFCSASLAGKDAPQVLRDLFR